MGLALLLDSISRADPSGGPGEHLVDGLERYTRRNRMVLHALHLATTAGYRCGIGWDEAAPVGLRVVVYIDLTLAGKTHQVSWHLPEYPGEWDGHDTMTKYGVIEKYRMEHCE